MAAAEGKVDARVAWISDRLQKAFTAIKGDKFGKLFNDADNLCVRSKMMLCWFAGVWCASVALCAGLRTSRGQRKLAGHMLAGQARLVFNALPLCLPGLPPFVPRWWLDTHDVRSTASERTRLEAM
jgi:hypothetical protein